MLAVAALGVGVDRVSEGRELTQTRHSALFAVILLGASFVAVSIGGYFRVHYFLFLYPALALLAGAAASLSVRMLDRSKALSGCAMAVLLGVAIGWPLVVSARFYATHSLEEITQSLFGASPFPDAEEVARRLTEQTTPADTIAVLGSEPQFFFLSQRRSATPHIYMFPLMEPHPFALRMQKELIGQVEAARPKFILVVKDGFSWNALPNSRREIFEWLDPYLKSNYYLDGRVDYFDEGPASFVFDSAGLAIPPKSERYLLIWRRFGT
jgi:hypothetical protein